MKLLDINLYFLYSILVNNMNIKLHFAHEKVISFSLPGLTQDLITFVHCPLNLLTGITPFWTLVEKENLEDIRIIRYFKYYNKCKLF